MMLQVCYKYCQRRGQEYYDSGELQLDQRRGILVHVRNEHAFV